MLCSAIRQEQSGPGASGETPAPPAGRRPAGAFPPGGMKKCHWSVYRTGPLVPNGCSPTPRPGRGTTAWDSRPGTLWLQAEQSTDQCPLPPRPHLQDPSGSSIPPSRTLPHWSGNPPKKSFFSKAMCFRAWVVSQSVSCSPPSHTHPFVLLTATLLSARKIEGVLWCCTNLCSGYFESLSFANLFWVPKLWWGILLKEVQVYDCS